ncbi:MAG: hypothetical protein ABJK28_00505 [Algibacter sp.]
MTREAHLKFCKKCTHRELDMKIGLVCDLTSEVANFNNECPSFELDKEVIEKIDDVEVVTPNELMEKLSERDIEKFRTEQNYPRALITGLTVGIIGAILWGVITVATGFQIGYMSIAIGAGVGLSMRYLGKGIDQIFGFTGGAISILSCLLGNFFSIVGYAANSEGLGYIEVLDLIDYAQIIPLMIETFSPMDVLFYGIAAFEGYKFSFRAFTEKDLYDLENNKNPTAN